MEKYHKSSLLETHIQTFKRTLTLLIVINLLSSCNSQISPTEMRTVANYISVELQNVFDHHTGYRQFKDQFRKGFTNGDFIVHSVDISKVSDKFSTDLGTSLINNIDSVRRIRDKAIELEKNYIFNEHDNLRYLNDKDNLTVNPAPTFAKGMEVNLTNSFVQVPTNIYRYSKEITNNAVWTKQLDETFLENYRKTPSLMWQYIGCETGMIRAYPGYKQSDPNALDTFDCRRRPWYNQAINSPKDIVIVLDLSGSMAGNNFQIAKLAVKSLIDNFNENDFFNVVYYNTSAYLIVPCKRKLTQATTFEKSNLKAAVDALHPPQGEADASRGLRLAFETLEHSRDNPMTSASCSQVIMLISDEMEQCDETDRVLKEHNKNKTITIFSYVIGQSESNAQTLKSISCNNGAQMYKFRTIGTVWNEVLKFQGILSHPLAKLDREYIVFTPLYWDWFGLGMMTTISTSIFSKNNATKTPTLLGVAAVDIRIAQLEDCYPQHVLGVFGYAFSINNNGLFLMHPKLREQFGESDPPTVFLHEVEYTTNPNKSVELERRMINNEKNCMTTEILNLFPRNIEKRIAQVNTTYCFEPITNTTFKSGIAIPIENQFYTQENKKPTLDQLKLYTKALISKKDGYNIEIAAWRFCEFPAAAQNESAASKRLFPKGSELYTYINNLTDLRPDECNLKLLSTLLLSAFKVDEVTMNRNIWNIEELIKNQILGIFIITSTGHFNSLVVDNETKIDIQRQIFQDDRFVHAQSYKSNFNMSESLVITVPIKKGTTPMKEHPRTRNITVTKLLTIPQKPPMGVVGMQIEKEYLDSLLKDCDGDKCNTFDCRYQDNHQCYLLDENGYVVTSNQIQNDTGVFFGYVNGILMEEFIKLKLFKLFTFIDRQAHCKTVKFKETSDTSASASIRLQSILKHVISFPYIIVDSCRTLFLYFHFATQALLAVATDEFFPPPEQEELFEEKIEEGCTKHIRVHLQTTKSISATGRIHCSTTCSKPYAIQSIPNTNMALVVISDVCDGDCSKYIVSDEAIRTNMYNKPCHERRKYRKNIPSCFTFKEHDQFCTPDRDSNDPHTRIYITAAVTLFLFSSFVFFVMCS